MKQEDKVNNPHPSYGALEVKRDVYRAVLGGTDGVRAKADKYLPKYPAEGDKEYDARLHSATIDGLVKGGVDQLCGSVFEEPIDVSKVNSSLVPHLTNVDNKGSSFDEFAYDAFRAAFEGCAVIVADSPNERAEDAAQEQTLGIRPYLSLYTADNVINWRFAKDPVSKQMQLVLLVLREISQEPKGEYGTADITRYRVFKLVNGKVTWELWREDGDKLTQEANGGYEKHKVIPAEFVGEVTDDPRLLVESRLEIRAYQKESSFDTIEYLSIPTFYTKGYEGDAALALGASAHVKLPLEGDVGYAQIDSAGLSELKKTIADIKEDIKSRVNYEMQAAVEKTATEVVTADKNKQARLIVWANNLTVTLNKVLGHMATFVGQSKGGEITLRTQWVVTAEKAAAMQQQQAKEQTAGK